MMWETFWHSSSGTCHILSSLLNTKLFIEKVYIIMTGPAQDNSLNDWFHWCHTHCKIYITQLLQTPRPTVLSKVAPTRQGYKQTKHNTSIVNWFLLWSRVNIFISRDFQNYLSTHLHVLIADHNSPQRRMGTLFEFRGWIVGSKPVKTTMGRCQEFCVVQKRNDSVRIHSCINCTR